jgi:hypothetical protein
MGHSALCKPRNVPQLCATSSGCSSRLGSRRRLGNSSRRSSCRRSTLRPACSRMRWSGPERTAKTATLRIKQALWLSWKYSSRVKGMVVRRCAETHIAEARGLNSQIVFEAEDRSVKAQAGSQLADGLWSGACGNIAARRACGYFGFRLDGLGFGLFRNLLRAARSRAAFAIATVPRAAGHVTSLAMHRRRDRGVCHRQRAYPDSGQRKRQRSVGTAVQRSHHSVSLRADQGAGK